jgi:hypothetical protein
VVTGGTGPGGADICLSDFGAGFIEKIYHGFPISGSRVIHGGFAFFIF